MLKWWKRRQPIGSASADAYRRHYQSQRIGRRVQLTNSINESWHAEEREHHRKERQIWKATLLLTTLAVIFTFVAVLLSKYSLDEARRQAEAATKTLQNEERPWIAPPVFETVRIVGDKPVFFAAFENVGKAPSQGFWVDADIVNDSGRDGDGWYAQASRLCAARKAEFRANAFSIVPTAKWRVDLNKVPSRLVSKNPSKFRDYSIREIRTLPMPIIIGCAIYGSRIDDTPHKIGFIGYLKVTGKGVNVEAVHSVDAG